MASIDLDCMAIFASSISVIDSAKCWYRGTIHSRSGLKRKAGHNVDS